MAQVDGGLRAVAAHHLGSRRGTPSSNSAMLVLSCTPANAMRAPAWWMSIAEADLLARLAAMAFQVVAS